MGTQPSTLDCKLSGNKQQTQSDPNQPFSVKHLKTSHSKQSSDTLSTHLNNAKVTPYHSPPVQYTSQANQIKKSPKSSSANIFIPEHEAISKVCKRPFRSSVKRNNLYFEQKGKSLAEIIETRYNTSKHFPYSQVLGLVESLVYGLAYLCKKNCNHHDFYPTNVYYNEGRFKIINPLEVPVSGFTLTKQRERFSFLSPQLIIAILEESDEQTLGEDIMNKSDVFAIGMILLQTCTLQPSSECYHEESYNIMDSVIKDRIAKVVKVYSPSLAQSINLMLQYEAQIRINPSLLAKLVHSKIQNQKLIAAQIQAPRFPSPQGLPPQPLQPVKIIMSSPQGPQLLPQQIQGPSPPYMHQTFKMQNLNQNVIAVSVPNETFTRIGPNNQGFLSSSSLQQKLRVIELIKQHPKEEDSDVEQDLKFVSSRIDEDEQEEQNNEKVQSPEQRESSAKPTYPLVESIYTSRPDPLKLSELEQKLPQVFPYAVSEGKTLSTPSPPLIQQKSPPSFQVLDQNKQTQNSYEYNRIQQRKINQPPNPEPKPPLKFHEQHQLSYPKEDLKLPNAYEVKKNQESGRQIPIRMVNSDVQIPSGVDLTKFNYQVSKEKFGYEVKQTFASSYPYANSLATNKFTEELVSKNPYANDNLNQFRPGQTSPPTQNISKKYGTSFQRSAQSSEETIDQRVQRVLKMSRNVR